MAAGSGGGGGGEGVCFGQNAGDSERGQHYLMGGKRNTSVKATDVKTTDATSQVHSEDVPINRAHETYGRTCAY